MSWTTLFDAALGIVELTYIGPITAEELRESASQANTLAKDRGTTFFLVDATEAILDASLVDVFNLPALHFVKEGVVVGSRIALTSPKSSSALVAAKFFADCCTSRGWIAQVLPGRNRAVQWLQGERKPTAALCAVAS